MRAIDRLRKTPPAADTPLLPVIRPHDWGMLHECAHRSLLRSRRGIGLPYVAIGRDTGDGLDLLLSDAPTQLGMSFAEVETFAIENLHLREAEWEVIHTNEGTGRPVLLGFEQDGIFSASRILDVAFLSQAQTRVGSKLLLVAVPHCRAIYVADASPMSDRAVHRAFSTWNQRHYDRASGVDALSPQIFLVRSGEIIGTYEPAADE